MTTLAIAFALAGAAISGYAWWLGWQQRQLQARLDALEAALVEPAAAARPRAA